MIAHLADARIFAVRITIEFRFVVSLDFCSCLLHLSVQFGLGDWCLSWWRVSVFDG